MPEWSDSEVAVDTDVSSPADQPMAPSGNCPPSAEIHAPYAAEPSHRRRAASAFIFVTITLDMLAMGMIAPVLPKLITGFMGGNEASGAEMFGIFGTVWAVMQFGFSPLLGSLSDRFGRRPIVLLSNFGLGIDYLVMALAPTLGWLFVGRVVSGITSASVPTAMAYIADVTDPKKRAEAFGMVSAAFGLGFVLGPALGGVLGNVSPRLPFWVAGGMSLLNAMYGLFVLPESLSKESRGTFSWRQANPLGSLTLLRRHRELFGMGCVLLLSYLTQQSLVNTLGAVHGLPLPVERAHGGLVAGAGGGGVGDCGGAAGAAAGEVAGAAQHAAVGGWGSAGWDLPSSAWRRRDGCFCLGFR